MKWKLAAPAFLVIIPLILVPLQAQERLRLATTTSVQDSGLMPYLMSHFEKKCGCKADVIAVGSGQALKLASNGDVDMVLVHDPASEEKFVGDGFGINRKTFMVNDFVILGPASDPAGIMGIERRIPRICQNSGIRRAFCIAGRRIRNASEGKISLEKSGDCSGRIVVSGHRPGHGCGIDHGERKEWVYDLR